MADARSLLRAKKATTVPKVDSPHATYTATGELKCVLCAVKGELPPPPVCRMLKLMVETDGDSRPLQ
jgi:hypothetical protein